MIKRIFWDLDECLIHTLLAKPDQEHFEFELFGAYASIYYTIVRPNAREIVDWSRDLVGKENVFVLTASVEEYAQTINRFGNLGFERNQIFHRQDLEDHKFSTVYGGSSTYPHSFAHPDNILIDNLPPKYNQNKMDFLGISQDRYLKVRDYYGVNSPNDPFESNVKEFLSVKAGLKSEEEYEEYLKRQNSH